MKRILVTGATGFIGSYLIPELAKEDYKLKCFVRAEKESKFKKNLEHLKKFKVEFFKGDIRNKESLIKALKEVDVLINLAAILGSRDIQLNYDINVLGAENIVEACKKENVRRIIHISSIAAVRQQKDIYGVTKNKSEKIFLDSGLDVTILRPTLVYGRGSRGFTKILKYVKKFPLIIPIIGSGNFKTQPVYVGDVVQVIIRCIKTDAAIGKVYFIAGPKALTFNEFVDAVCSKLGIKKIKIHIPIFICKMAAKIFETIQERPEFCLRDVISINQDTIADITMVEKDLGYSPINFMEFIRKTSRDELDIYLAR